MENQYHYYETKRHYTAEDLKMPEIMFTFEGRDFILRCNMCVVDAVTDLYGGDPAAMFSDRTSKSVMAWLAAMMNDYAEAQEWPDFKPYTAKGLSRKLKPNPEFLKEVMELVIASIGGPGNVALADPDPVPVPDSAPAPATAPEASEEH